MTTSGRRTRLPLVSLRAAVYISAMADSRAVLVLEVGRELERSLDELLRRAQVRGAQIHPTRESVARIALARGLEELLAEVVPGVPTELQ